MSRKRKKIIEGIFRNEGLLTPYLNSIQTGEKFISSASGRTSTEIVIDNNEGMISILESLDSGEGVVAYDRESQSAKKFKQEMSIDDVIYANMTNQDLARYHLAYQQMLVDNPNATEAKINVLNADFAEEMQAHMYQMAKQRLVDLLGAQELNANVRLRAQELQALIQSYEGTLWGYWRQKNQLLTGLLATIKYVEANDPDSAEALSVLPQEMNEITEYKALMTTIDQKQVNGNSLNSIRNRIIRRVQWGAYPGFSIPMKDRIAALKAVNAIDEKDWETYNSIKGEQVPHLLSQLEEMEYFQRNAQLVEVMGALPERVRDEFNNLRSKIAIRFNEDVFGFRIPLEVRSRILAAAMGGIEALTNGREFVIDVDTPHKEYIENEIAKINYAWKLSNLEKAIEQIEDSPLKRAALNQLKASIDGYGSYFTLQTQKRTAALALAQKLATGDGIDQTAIDASPYRKQILNVLYATKLDKYNDAVSKLPGETLVAVKAAYQDMKTKTEWALFSSLTIEQRTQGLAVLARLIAGETTSQISDYEQLPKVLKRKADRIEYEVNKAKFNSLRIDANVPNSVKEAVQKLSTRADNTYSSFRLHIRQRGIGFMAGILLMEAAKTGDDHKAQLDSLYNQAKVLLSNPEKYGIYKEEIDQVVISMASNQIDEALNRNQGLTPETKRVIKELQEYSKDTRIPLETRLNALKSARDYVADPTEQKKSAFEIEVRKIPAFFRGEGYSRTNLLWTNPAMAGFSSHIDEFKDDRDEAVYRKLGRLLGRIDSLLLGEREKNAILKMKDKIDTAAISSWSGLTHDQRLKGLEFLSNYISEKSYRGVVLASGVNGYNELPPVLQRRADAISYGYLQDRYLKVNTLKDNKDMVELITKRADSRWRVDIKTRVLGYMIALKILEAMKPQENDKDFSVLDRLEEIANQPDHASYKAAIEKIVMKQASNQLKTALSESTGINEEYKTLLRELDAITKDSRIPLAVRVEAMKAATAYATYPTTETQNDLASTIKKIPDHFTKGAGKSVFNCLWTTPKMTGFMTRINDTMGRDAPIVAVVVNQANAQADGVDEDHNGYVPPVYRGQT